MSKMLKFFRDLKKNRKIFLLKKSMKNENFALELWKKTSKFFPMKKSIKNENFAKTTKDFPIKKCEFAC